MAGEHERTSCGSVLVIFTHWWSLSPMQFVHLTTLKPPAGAAWAPTAVAGIYKGGSLISERGGGGGELE